MTQSRAGFFAVFSRVFQSDFTAGVASTCLSSLRFEQQDCKLGGQGGEGSEDFGAGTREG